MRRLLFVVALILPATVFAASSGIPRLEKVAEGFYRGGQPDRAGFEYLKKEGIRTVINLRDEYDEEPIVKELGLKYIHIPMSVKPWSRISDKNIEKYFAILNDPANYPIFIHCRRGADRTGAMVGFYRIAAQGWDGKKAVVEARKIGMRFWYWGLKSQLESFARKSKSGPSLFKLTSAPQLQD